MAQKKLTQAISQESAIIECDGPYKKMGLNDLPKTKPYGFEDNNVNEYDIDDPEKFSRIVTGLVAVIRPAVMADGSDGWLLGTLSIKGKYKELLVAGENLGQPSQIAELGNYLIVVHNIPKLGQLLKLMAADVAHRTPQIEVAANGWTADRRVFSTGKKLICGAGVDASYMSLNCASPSRMDSNCEMEEWWDNVGQPACLNRLPLAMMCSSLASPLLEWTTLGSSSINLFGTPGTGKTLCLGFAASIWGNGSDPSHASSESYIRSFNSTLAALEGILSECSPGPALLDEVTVAKLMDFGTMTYTLASGGGKNRSTSSGKLAAPRKWLLNTIMTSEKSIKSLMAEKGEAISKGQADRVADIPVPVEGLFTEFGDFGDFDSFASHMKEATGAFFGVAGEVFMKFCADDPDRVQEYIDSLDDLTTRLTPPGCGGGALRIVKKFALSELAGYMAVDAGILKVQVDEQVDAIHDAHQFAVDLWWRAREVDLFVIAEFIDRNAAYVMVGKPTTDCPKVRIFEHEGKYFIHEDVFDAEFAEGLRLLNRLLNLGVAVKKPGSGRFVHYPCYTNRAFKFYAFDADKIRPHLREALQKPHASTLEAEFE
jgi:hypothetical protein